MCDLSLVPSICLAHLPPVNIHPSRTSLLLLNPAEKPCVEACKKTAVITSLLTLTNNLTARWKGFRSRDSETWRRLRDRPQTVQASMPSLRPYQSQPKLLLRESSSSAMGWSKGNPENHKN